MYCIVLYLKSDSDSSTTSSEQPKKNTQATVENNRSSMTAKRVLFKDVENCTRKNALKQNCIVETKVNEEMNASDLSSSVLQNDNGNALIMILKSGHVILENNRKSDATRYMARNRIN